MLDVDVIFARWGEGAFYFLEYSQIPHYYVQAIPA